jgi:hypothetical protein
MPATPRGDCSQCTALTECSSCLTSNTVPSLKLHLTISVSSDTPFTHSLFSSLLQKEAKFCSLMRCQTALMGASITADSVTEVEVGIRDIVIGYYAFTRRTVSGMERLLAIGIIRLIEVYYLVASSAALLSGKLPDLPLPRAETAEQTSNSGRIMTLCRDGIT